MDEEKKVQTRRVPVTIDEHMAEILGKLRVKYPHLSSESLLIRQAMQEWEWRQESGDSRGSNIRKTLEQISEVKDLVSRIDARVARMEDANERSIELEG